MENKQNLEGLVEKLAHDIRNYPKTNKNEIMQLARELDEKTHYGEKQGYKDLFIQNLGYTIKRQAGMGTINTISSNILYLNGLGVKNIAKIVGRRPEILSLKIEYMQPRIDWLKEQGVTDIGKVITKVPSVLALKIEYMQPRIDWLKEQGVNDIAKVITKNPRVLVYSIENCMQPRVGWLKEQGVTNIGKVITRAPSVLALKIENNLNLKFNYFTKEMGFDVCSIEKNPVSLTYNLQKRIIPRYEYLKSKNLEGRYGLAHILYHNDKNFAIKAAKSTLKDYKKFKEGVIKRLETDK